MTENVEYTQWRNELETMLRDDYVLQQDDVDHMSIYVPENWRTLYDKYNDPERAYLVITDSEEFEEYLDSIDYYDEE